MILIGICYSISLGATKKCLNSVEGFDRIKKLIERWDEEIILRIEFEFMLRVEYGHVEERKAIDAASQCGTHNVERSFDTEANTYVSAAVLRHLEEVLIEETHEVIVE